MLPQQLDQTRDSQHANLVPQDPPVRGFVYARSVLILVLISGKS